MQNLDFLTGEERLQEILRSRGNAEIITGTVVDEIVDGDALSCIVVQKTSTGEKTRLYIDGMFVAIGLEPENENFKNIADLDKYGYIDTDETCATKTPGVFVAGDCRKKAVRQVATAVADGAVAAISACRYIDAL